MTLEEAWFGFKADVYLFKVFQSHAWAHILKKKRKALDSMSKPPIFIGYCEYMKAYRLDPNTHYIFHIHVQFDSSPHDSFSILDDSHDFLIVDLTQDSSDANSSVENPAPVVTMPKWARTIVEEPTPFNQDLSPSTGSWDT